MAQAVGKTPQDLAGKFWAAQAQFNEALECRQGEIYKQFEKVEQAFNALLYGPQDFRVAGTFTRGNDIMHMKDAYDHSRLIADIYRPCTP